MPISIPQSVQYQGALVSVPGLWNARPKQDRFVPCEIDWGTLTPGYCVQISLGNMPVDFGPPVAVSVDNTRNGSPINFITTDTGGQVSVPAYGQGIFPLLTNSRNLYVQAPQGGPGDITVFALCNSMPPPVAFDATVIPGVAAVAGILLSANATTNLVPASITGTLKGFSLSFGISTGGAAQIASVYLRDGAGANIWAGVLPYAASTSTAQLVQMSGINQRFYQGLNAIVTGSTMTAGSFAANVYYTVP